MAQESRKKDSIFFSYQEGSADTPDTDEFFEGRGMMTLPEPTWLQESDYGKLGSGEHGKATEIQAIGASWSYKPYRMSEIGYLLAYFLGLGDDYMDGFNAHMQETLYGQTGTPLQADIIGLKAGDIPIDQIGGKDSDIYQYLLSDASVPVMGTDPRNWDIAETGEGGDSRTTIPQLEGKKFINYGGNIFEVTSQSIDDKAGDDDTKYVLTNVLTGEVANITASEERHKMSENRFNMNSTNPTDLTIGAGQ